jgi:DNA-binding transcriptional MerR regulator
MEVFMTVKEIAELCGVNETTVLRWIHKTADDLLQNAEGSKMNNAQGDPMQNAQGDLRNFYEGLKMKLSDAQKTGSIPADFTLEETIAIIGDGGKNKTLAALLAENAANKNAVAARNGTTAIFEQLLARLDRIEKALSAGLSANNTDKPLLPDPKEEAYRELRQFVEQRLIITAQHKRDSVIVDYLYDKYRSFATMILPIDEFMYKIAIDNPQIRLIQRRSVYELSGCMNKY